MVIPMVIMKNKNDHNNNCNKNDNNSNDYNGNDHDSFRYTVYIIWSLTCWLFGLSYYFLIQPRTNVMCEGLHYTTRIVWKALKTGLQAIGYNIDTPYMHI